LCFLITRHTLRVDVVNMLGAIVVSLN